MRFSLAPNSGGSQHRMISEGGLVEIDVVDGSVQAGLIGDEDRVIDWPCDGQMNHLWSKYTAIYLLLRSRVEDRRCFDGIPSESIVSPCWMDERFEQSLTDAILRLPKVSEATESN